MSDWLIVGASRHILRFPPGIGRRRVAQFAKRARTEVGALSAEQRAIHHFVVRELPRSGRPMPPRSIADGLDLPLDAVVVALADLEARKGFLFRDDEGSVLWAYPVTAATTPHRIRFRSGETLYAAWAADAIATPFVQGQLRNEPVSITVETRCEHCMEPMTLEVDADMTVRTEQPGAAPLVFMPNVAPFDVVDVSIIDDFWCENVFLWSEDHAREYRRKTHRTRGVYSPVERVAEINRIVQSALFGFDWDP